MTLEAARPQNPAQVPQDPRLQLAERFRKPRPSVPVTIKKRRIATSADIAVDSMHEGAAVNGQQSVHETASRGPRVHRPAKPLSDESVRSGPA